MVETFGKTAIHSVRVGLSSGADAHLGDFSSSYSTQLTESFEEMVPADVLGKLPNLQYFASVSGGRIIRGGFRSSTRMRMNPEQHVRRRRRRSGPSCDDGASVVIRIVSIAACCACWCWCSTCHRRIRQNGSWRRSKRAPGDGRALGRCPALRILDRALGLRARAREATPVPPTAGASAASGVDGAVAREMASVNQRLFGNSYFRAIDALVLLAAFRASAMIESLPWLAVAHWRPWSTAGSSG